MEVMVLALTNNHYIISQVDEVATEDIGHCDINGRTYPIDYLRQRLISKN